MTMPETDSHHWRHLGVDYFRLGRERWVRIGRVQLGWHPAGRFRLFSERELGRRGIPTLRLGRRAEISCGLVRR